MWFRVKAADVGFADTARRHFTYDFRVPTSPAETFEAIALPERMGRWFPDLKGVRWLSAPPHGVGSVREVRLKPIGVHERVLVFEPGVRFSFTIVKATAPILARMVEDFRLTRVLDGTRVQWTIAYRPRRGTGLLEPLLRPVFSRMFRQASEQLRAHLAAGAS